MSWAPVNPYVDHVPQGCTAIADWRSGWKFYASDTEVLEIRGSWHKLRHGDNWQDFTHAEYVEVLDEFCETFRLFDGALHFLNLELGVNVAPPVPTAELLPRVLFHRTTRPIQMDEPAVGLVVARKGHYRIKMYDKALQYDLPIELLRCEVHVDRMERLRSRGISTALDLRDPKAWERASQFLMAKVDELFFVDTDVPPQVVTRQQAQLLAKAGDFAFWMGLSPKKRSDKRRKVERLFARHSLPCLKGELLEAMDRKLIDLRTVGARGDI